MKNKKVNLNDICFFQEGPGVRKTSVFALKGVKTNKCFKFSKW